MVPRHCHRLLIMHLLPPLPPTFSLSHAPAAATTTLLLAIKYESSFAALSDPRHCCFPHTPLTHPQPPPILHPWVRHSWSLATRLMGNGMSDTMNNQTSNKPKGAIWRKPDPKQYE